MSTEWVISRLGEADRAAWASVVESVGWRFSAEEMDLFFATGETWGARRNGELVGVASVYRYEGPLAWLGNVAVVPDAQGKGVGTRLVQHVISQVEGSGEDTPLVLVARRELAPLYARHGFRAAGEVIRLEAARVLAPPLPQEPLAPGEDRDAWGDVLALDRRAFGADRSQVLQRAIRGADKTVVVRDGELAPQGMGVATASGEGTRLGPIVAQSDIMALNLLHLLAEDAEGPVVIDVWAERASFVHRLRKLGFEERMTSALMIRGNPKRWTQRPELYALLRPALG